MAASGNYTLALTVNQAAKRCYKLLQAVGDGESLSGDHSNDFKDAGNLLLKAWQAQGLHLWTESEGTLFLENSKKDYDFRLAGTKASNEWFETTTTAATIAGAYVIPVTSDDNIVTGDTIGVIQNDNNLFWSTVTFSAGDSITVADPITLPTVSGSFVRNYRDTLIPISRITDIRRRESTDYEIPIVMSSREAYYGLPNKDQTGTPIQVYYDRQDIAGEKYGVMNVWSPPSTCVPTINFTYERKLQIMTDANETIDIPDYAQKALIYNIAKDLILEYGCAPERAALIRGEAMTLLEDMLSFDSDSLPFEVNFRQHA